MDISNSNLVKELQKRNKKSIVDNIEKVRTKVSPLLGRISVLFTHYTNHDVSHSEQVLFNMNWLIPGKVVSELNEYEIQILVLACYLHDIGMLVGGEEFESIVESDDFELFKRNAYATSNDLDDKELMCDYIRNNHHIRSEKYIVDNYQALGIEEYAIAKAVGIIARGHRVEDLLDIGKYSYRHYVVSGENPVCLSFLTGCLRIADELDITRVRTPELLEKLVTVKNPISKQEWDKHKRTLAIGPDGNKIKIQAECDDPVIHRAILITANKIKEAIDIVNKVLSTFPPDLKDKYYLDLDGVMEPQIEEIGYLYRNFNFNFDTVALSNLLMGEKLYRSKFDACRELLQNSIDTCRMKTKIKVNWKPIISIGVSKDKNIIWVEDNGMGMDEFIIENYLLRVGRSYYNSNDFEYRYPDVKMNAISEFGIGILSCFMIAESFVIETYMDGNSPRRLEISGIGDEVVVRNGSRSEAGTRIEITLKQGIIDELSNEKLIEKVKYYIRHVEIPINVVRSDGIEVKVVDEGYEFNLTNALEPFKRDRIENYVLVETQIDPIESDGIRGKIGTILKKNLDESLVPVYWAWRDFKDTYGFGSFGMDISQKGIFISRNIGWNIWYRDGWFGNLNIEHPSSLELRVPRDSFVFTKSENIIDKVIQNGISKLLKEIFDKEWNKLESEGIAEITHKLIEGYITLRSGISMGIVMTPEVEKVIEDNFLFRIVKNGSLGYSNLYNFIDSLNTWLLVPFSLDTESEIILEEAEAIKRECGISDLLLAGSQVSPRGAFEFLESYLGNKYYWRIASSKSNRRSYYEYIKDKERVIEDDYGYLFSGIKISDFSNQKQMIGTHIDLERFLNKDHNLIKKLINISNRLDAEDLELIRAFFHEIDESLCITTARLSKRDFADLVEKQGIILNSLYEKGNISQKEREELVLKKEELPEWRLATDFTSNMDR